MSLINSDTYGDYNIRLKTLEKEYQVLLNSYLEAKKSYIEAMQNSAKGTNNYTILNDTDIRGGQRTKIIEDISDIEKCKALCAENKCKGAQYYGNSRECIFNSMERIGLSPIPKELSTNRSAIVDNSIYRLFEMNKIIMELLKVNNQIIRIIENIDPSYVEDIEAKKVRGDELYKNYKQLINERDMVNTKLDEYSTLSQKFTEENINADKQYSHMNIWLFLVIFILLYALREIFGFSISFIPIFILSFVFFLTLNIGLPIGFLIWLGVIGLLLFLYFMNMA